MPQMSPLPWLLLMIMSLSFVVVTACFISYYNVLSSGKKFGYLNSEKLVLIKW